MAIKNELCIEKFENLYYFEFGKNFSHIPETHDIWEMVYVDNGRIKAISGEETILLEQGQVIFHAPYEVHAHISDKLVANNMLVVSFISKSPAMDFFKGKAFTLDKSTKKILSLFLNEARNALDHIPDNYEKKEDLTFAPEAIFGEQLLLCYFTEFLITLMREYHNPSSLTSKSKSSNDITTDALGEMVISYMKDNIYSNVSIKDLCEVFLVGKTQLCKIFNETVNQSPIEYYSNLKIKEAKKLLREKNYSITQISEMLGYSSIHTFSRAFKKAAGFSPTAYMHSIL